MRLLIVADNALAAEAIRRLFRHMSNCRCLGFVSFAQPEAIPAGDAAPDVVVVDGDPRRSDVIARIPAIRGAAPHSKLVLLAGRLDGAWLDEATGAGIDAVVSRSLHPTTLGTLVREVVAGTVFHVVSPGRRPARVPAFDGTLTGRELEILRLVAGGASNARIAGRLWVTEQTVKFHLSNVYRKLGVANRTEASHYAHTRGLLDLAALAGSSGDPSQPAAAAAAA
jgi:DNA-binding NarL/FixJ family response regulator